MKTLTALLLSGGLLGGGLGILMAANTKTSSPSPTTITADVKRHLLQMPLANLKAVECKQVQNGIEIPGAVCFLSSLPPEQLLEQVKKTVDGIASTPGWSQDYLVWHAFYSSRAAPTITFGVNIGDPHNSATYQANNKKPEAKSFVAFAVDSAKQ